MLGTIVKKELLSNITSLRFVLALLLLIVVFAVGGFVFVSRYNLEMSEFSEETNKNLSALNETTNNLRHLAYHVQTITKGPKITRLFCEGNEKLLPNTFKLDVFGVQLPEIGRASCRERV